jgi:hypothetical protein
MGCAVIARKGILGLQDDQQKGKSVAFKSRAIVKLSKLREVSKWEGGGTSGLTYDKVSCSQGFCDGETGNDDQQDAEHVDVN